MVAGRGRLPSGILSPRGLVGVAIRGSNHEASCDSRKQVQMQSTIEQGNRGRNSISARLFPSFLQVTRHESCFWRGRRFVSRLRLEGRNSRSMMVR